MKKRFGFQAVAVAGVAGCAVGVMCMVGVLMLRFGGLSGFPYAAKFAEVYGAIKNDYIGQADMDAVSDAAYSAMVKTAGDRWSYYMTAEEYEQYKLRQNNSYNGIGVTIKKDDVSGLYQVIVVQEDTPASRAGIKAGDLMVCFSGQSLAGKSSEDIKTLISGTKEAFELTLRDESGAERTVSVSKAVVHTEPVSYELLDGGIGYIRIKNFENGVGDDIIAALDELTEQGAKGVVFDVRNNPGGLLTELLKALDHILPEGDLFVSVTKTGKEKVSTSDASCVKLPMAVLINANTYSAAEFFGAALSEYDWATLVGSPSTGKSRSQVNIMLLDGSAVHLSTNGYLTPDRTDLAKQGGLKPDKEVALSENDENALIAGVLNKADDAQLKAALTALEDAAA